MRTNLNSPPRPPLDRQRIVVTALGLIDESGISQLTMRSIGTALNVEAMSLYHHFKNKSQLLDGVKDHLLNQLVARVGTRGTPLERIGSTFEQLRRIAIDHPDIASMLGASGFCTARAKAFLEELFAMFYAAGLNPEQSARYYCVLSRYTLGWSLFAMGAHDQLAPPSPGEINAALFPCMAQAMPYADEAHREINFQFGLRLIMDALRAEITVP